MNQQWLKSGIGALLVVGMATPAMAQVKRDPSRTNSAASLRGPKPDFALWKESYSRAGRPRIMILCGIEAPGGGAPGGLGSNIDPFDATGDPAALLAGISDTLMQNRDVRLVHPGALDAADRRTVQILRQDDPRRAMHLLCTKLKADFTFLVRMTPDPKPGVRYTVVLELLEVGSARPAGSFAFDWKLDNDAGTIRMYATRIAGKMIEEFANYANDPTRDFDVQIVGVPTVDDFRTARDAIKAMPHVKDVIGDDFSGAGAATLGNLNVRFEGGALDLIYELQNLSKQKLGLSIDNVDAAYGKLTLVMHRKLRWQQLLETDNAVVRGDFQKAYAARESPRVAVVIGHALSDREAVHEAEGSMDRLIAALRAYDAARQNTGDRQGQERSFAQVQSAASDLRHEFAPPPSAEASAHGAATSQPSSEPSGDLPPQTKGLTAVIDKFQDRLLDIPFHLIDKLTDSPGKTPEVINTVVNAQTQLAAQAVGLDQAVPVAVVPGALPATAPVTVIEPRRQFQARIVDFLPPRELREALLARAEADAGPDRPTPVDPDRLVAGITKRLLDLKLDIADADKVRQNIAVAAAKTHAIYREDQLAAILRNQEQIQILIVGVPEISGDGAIAGYSFKAVRTSDGAVLAADGWSSPLGAAREDALNAGADYLAGNLAEQLWGIWSSPGRLLLRIDNVKSMQDVRAIAAAIRDTAPDVTSLVTESFDVGVDTGVATCRVTYACSREDLIARLDAASKKLPFDLLPDKVTAESLTVRVRDGLK